MAGNLFTESEVVNDNTISRNAAFVGKETIFMSNIRDASTADAGMENRLGKTTCPC